MPARRNTQAIEDDHLLTAARDCLLAVGWRRTTMTDVARRAGVSRMSVYRRWPDMSALIGDLMTREWSTVGSKLAESGPKADADGIARAIATVAAEIRAGELFGKIVDVDPELLLPYLMVRRGRTQDAMLESIETAIKAGQGSGAIRKGKVAVLARSVLLITYGFVFSANTMADGKVSERMLFDELRLTIRSYLQ